MRATDVKKNIPFITLLSFLKSVQLQRIYNAFVLGSSNFISKLHIIDSINSVGLNLFYSAAFGIFKEDGGRPVLKWTPQYMYFAAFF